jgi:hypothetical protein
VSHWIKMLPHSQCTLRENPKFSQNFRSKNSTLREKFWLLFLFNFSHCISGLAFTSKNYYIAAQNCMYFIRENSQKLCQKRKWALWMRPLSNLSFKIANFLLPLLRWKMRLLCHTKCNFLHWHLVLHKFVAKQCCNFWASQINLPWNALLL